MTSQQSALEYVKDQMAQCKMNASEANVMLVQMVGVKVVSNKLPMEVRRALNDAVKAGQLGRIKKDGLKPEVYHHKNARGKALEEQRRIEREALESLKGMFA